MISSYELWIAYRYLKARRQDGFISIVSWFSLIGISLGVATLIIVMSVMNGFRDELLTRIIGMNGHASLYLNENAKVLTSNNIKSVLNDFEEVTDVIPIVESSVMISYKNRSKGIVARGININDYKDNKLLINNTSIDAIEKFNEDGSVILGSKYLR